MSDARLVRRSQQGDRDAFLAFLRRYDHRLRGMTYALVTSSTIMDRVLRTAYLRAWREIVRVGSGEDPKGWLYRLAYNGCIDELRRESSPASSRPPVDEDDPLAAALAALTPEQRVAVVLVDREGFAPEGAARIAGVDTAAFAERLAVGRAALAETLPTAAPRRRDAPGGSGGPRAGGRRRPRPQVGSRPAAEAHPPAEGALPAEAVADPPAGTVSPAEARPAPVDFPEPAGPTDPAGLTDPAGEAEVEATLAEPGEPPRAGPPPGRPPRPEVVAAMASSNGGKGAPGVNGHERRNGSKGAGGGTPPDEGSEGT